MIHISVNFLHRALMIAKSHAEPTPNIQAKYHHIIQFPLIHAVPIVLDIFNRHLTSHEQVHPGCVNHYDRH